MPDGLAAEEIGALLDESRMRLSEVEGDLMDLEDGKAEASPEFVNRVFRAFHSVKGAAGYLGYESLARLSHASEDVLGEARDGKLHLSSAHAAVLLSAVDRMRRMVAPGGREAAVEFATELERLKAILKLPRKPAPAGVGARLRSRRLKVLVVEDEFTSRVILQELLSKYGDCHIAANGREAVHAFRSAWHQGQNYDLICMDIQMPEMDGQEAVRQIRAIEEDFNAYGPAGVRIFMTTAIQDIKAVVGSFQALCDAYLFKPIEGAKLEDHLRAFGLIR